MQLGRLDAEVDRLVSDKKQLEKENAELKAAFNDRVRIIELQLEDKKSLAEALGASNICLRDWFCTGGAKNTAEILSNNSKLIDKHLTEGIDDE